MASGTELNPGGAGYFNFIENGAEQQEYVIDPEVEGDSPFGTVVELEDYSGPGTTNPPAVPLVQPSSTDQLPSVIGVIIGGLSGYATVQKTVPPGKVAQVMTNGICRVLCDATTVAGDVLISSPDTAGCARTTADPSTRTIGLCLESVTIDSGTALVWCWVNPGTQGGSGGGDTVAHAQLTENADLTADGAVSVLTVDLPSAGTWMLWANVLIEYGADATGVISTGFSTGLGDLIGGAQSPLPAPSVLGSADPAVASIFAVLTSTEAGDVTVVCTNADTTHAGTALAEDPTTSSSTVTGVVALKVA